VVVDWEDGKESAMIEDWGGGMVVLWWSSSSIIVVSGIPKCFFSCCRSLLFYIDCLKLSYKSFDWLGGNNAGEIEVANPAFHATSLLLVDNAAQSTNITSSSLSTMGKHLG
jgi:hypothetical protein